MSISDRYQRIAELRNLDGIMQAVAVTRRRMDLHLETPYRPPSGTEESSIVDIWKEVLGLDEVGVDDSFYDLGGDSLHITQVLNRIRDVFRVELDIDVFFDGPTVQELLRAVRRTESNVERDVDTVAPDVG